MTRCAVGIGLRPGAPARAVHALLDRVAAEHRIDLDGAVFATVDARAGEAGLRDVVPPGGRALVAWPAADLADEPVPHPSARTAAAVGTPSVAEAAALRTARTLPGATGADLVVPKVVGDGVTVAVAVPRREPSPTRGR